MSVTGECDLKDEVSLLVDTGIGTSTGLLGISTLLLVLCLEG